RRLVPSRLPQDAVDEPAELVATHVVDLDATAARAAAQSDLGLQSRAEQIHEVREIGIEHLELGAPVRARARRRTELARQLLGLPHRERIAHDAIAQRATALGARHAEDRLGVAGRERTALDVALHLA